MLLSTQPRLARLWTDEGPTEEAMRLAESGWGAMSSGEEVLLRSAFELAERRTELRFSDVMRLDAARMEALCSLLIAIDRGGAAVAWWITDHAELPRCPGCGEALTAPDRGKMCRACMSTGEAR